MLISKECSCCGRKMDFRNKRRTCRSCLRYGGGSHHVGVVRRNNRNIINDEDEDDGPITMLQRLENAQRDIKLLVKDNRRLKLKVNRLRERLADKTEEQDQIHDIVSEQAVQLRKVLGMIIITFKNHTEEVASLRKQLHQQQRTS